MSRPRKRSWTNADGTKSIAWSVSYNDRSGKRRWKQFGTRAEAAEFAATVTSAVRSGEYVPDTITVARAAERWLEACEKGREGREPVEPHTLRVYKLFADHHIKPFLGAMKLTDLSAGRVKEFRDKDLLGGGRSRSMTKKVLTALSSICREAVADELLGLNPCVGVQIRTAGRHKEKVYIPPKTQVQALVRRAAEWAAPTGRRGPSGDEMSPRKYVTRARAVWFYTLQRFIISTGVRLSEARGAPVDALDLRRRVFSVRQRADEKNRIGACKSAAAYRELELSDGLCADLESWLAVAPGKTLLFGNANDQPDLAQNIYKRFWLPLVVDLGYATQVTDEAGRTTHDTTFTIHHLRHFHASLMIERGMQPKQLQEHMGHSSIQVTMDTYGHLFKDDLARAQRRKLIVAADDDLIGYPLLDSAPEKRPA